jgi:assimilatory nitrate reductase catalytic subunit
VVDGRIKGLWVIGTNPAHSWVDQSHLQELFDRLEVLVVQDMYSDTETARRADLFLPAAGWAEKEGTFINSERRIGRVRAVHRPPGQARSDFEIIKGIAEEWGCGPMFRRWRSPSHTFDLLRALSAGRPCDFTGIDGFAGLDAGGDGVQWPLARPEAEGHDEPVQQERRLFGDGKFFHPDGRARFVADSPTSPPERPSPRYPLVLLTGRGSTAQWHTQTRTSRSVVLAGLAPDRLFVDISPTDAADRGLSTGDEVTVSCRQGEVSAAAFVTNTVAPGQVFLPMHDHHVNVLTSATFDPWSRQPSYKYSAVQVRPTSSPHG